MAQSTPAHDLAPHSSAPAPPFINPAVLDWDAALARLGGRTDLLHEMVDLLATSSRQDLAAMRQAIDNQDVQTLHRLLHQLKGSVSWFGAASVVAVANRLGDLAKDGISAGVLEAFTNLVSEVDRLKQALAVRVCKDVHKELAS